MASACSGDPESLLSLEQLEAQRHQAEVYRDECRQRREHLETLLRATRTEFAVEADRIARIHTELATLNLNLRNGLERYPDHQRASEIARLATLVEQMRSDLSTAEENALRLRAVVPSEQERARIYAQVSRLTESIEKRRRASQQLALDIAALQERIAVRGGDGVGERESALADEAEVAERELIYIDRQVTAWRLLRDTVDACSAETRDTFLSPVKMAMKPFLQKLFPGADADLDENFVVESLKRDEVESFDYLSHGTREQISVLVRLGLGRLIAERGQPVPILLDDALVFSDDDRIERMFEALSEAAYTNQVIVLTCRSRVFQSFGGRRLRLDLDCASAPMSSS
jgi:uncharacterized protein YhaN